MIIQIYLLIFQKQFNLPKNNIKSDQHNIIWIIHSIICYCKDGYYSIVTNNKEWYLHDSKKFPSLIK